MGPSANPAGLRTNRARLLIGGSLYVIASLALAGSAYAQDSGKIETITVTAERRAENIQNVPLSIVAVNGNKLARSGISNVTQLDKIVPDLQVQKSTQSAGVSFRIRGFGASSNTAIDPDVASYIDGVYIPRPGALLSSFLDVKRIEVLRGPQGTLFGRNAAMGAISITTNPPSTKAQKVKALFEAGSYDHFLAQGIINMPLSDRFAVRLAVSGDHEGGHYKNLFDGKTYGASDVIVGRLGAKWDINQHLNWRVTFDYSQTNGDGVNPGLIDVSTATPAQLTAMTAFITRLGGTPPVFSSTPSLTFNQRKDNPRLHDGQYGLASDIHWTISPNITVRLIDSYRNWNDRQTDGDVLFTTLNMLNRHASFSSKSQSHELQIITPQNAFLGGKLGFTAGLYYFQESYSLREVLDLGSQLCSTFLGAHPALAAACKAAPQLGATVAPFHQSTYSEAAYLQADYAILRNLSLTLGVRQTWDNKTGSFQQIVNNPYAKAPFIPVRAPENDPNLKFSDSRPTWLASLSWHVTPKLMTFASFSTGYKSGGFNSATGTSVPATRVFGSETIDDYELGMKSIWWSNQLLLNLTLFNTTLHNFQDRSFNGTSFIVRNAGSVRSRGAELEGQLSAIKHVNLNFGLSYLDSIYESDPGAPGLPGCTGAPGCPLTQDLSGRQLPFAPKWQGHVGASIYSNPFMGGYIGTLAVNEFFTSGFGTQNTDALQAVVSSYALTDLRVGVISPDGKWELDFYGKNIFDKHYFYTLYPQPDGKVLGINNPVTGATLYRGLVGDPQTFGVRLSYNF